MTGRIWQAENSTGIGRHGARAVINLETEVLDVRKEGRELVDPHLIVDIDVQTGGAIRAHRRIDRNNEAADERELGPVQPTHLPSNPAVVGYVVDIAVHDLEYHRLGMIEIVGFVLGAPIEVGAEEGNGILHGAAYNGRNC